MLNWLFSFCLFVWKHSLGSEGLTAGTGPTPARTVAGLGAFGTSLHLHFIIVRADPTPSNSSSVIVKPKAFESRVFRQNVAWLSLRLFVPCWSRWLQIPRFSPNMSGLMRCCPRLGSGFVTHAAYFCPEIGKTAFWNVSCPKVSVRRALSVPQGHLVVVLPGLRALCGPLRACPLHPRLSPTFHYPASGHSCGHHTALSCGLGSRFLYLPTWGLLVVPR